MARSTEHIQRAAAWQGLTSVEWEYEECQQDALTAAHKYFVKGVGRYPVEGEVDGIYEAILFYMEDYFDRKKVELRVKFAEERVEQNRLREYEEE